MGLASLSALGLLVEPQRRGVQEVSRLKGIFRDCGGDSHGSPQASLGVLCGAWPFEELQELANAEWVVQFLVPSSRRVPDLTTWKVIWVVGMKMINAGFRGTGIKLGLLQPQDCGQREVRKKD